MTLNQRISTMRNRCFRKRAFRTYDFAQGIAEKWNKKEPPEDGMLFRAYSCPDCFHFHVGRYRP